MRNNWFTNCTSVYSVFYVQKNKTMKDSVIKSLIQLILKVKGKKPVVIAITLCVFALGYYAVQKGYISQELFDSGILTDHVDSIIDQAVVDTLNVVDTLSQAAPVIDTSIN